MTKFEQTTIDKITSLYDKLQEVECKEREVPEETAEGRSEYARDYARILYSSSFRRLQGKMQILGIETTAFYRNRLTHSLEVSQIARSLAKILAFKCGKEMYCDEELYLLDAAALAHDIGHPAFGHKGERVLDEIAKLYGLRFEGNAQNFRVLRKLDRHGSSPKGLNLTYRTLLAINKYIESEKTKTANGDDPKKFMYQEDYVFLDEFRQKNEIKKRTIDVQIIEIADDIAYAVHDLEDGLAQGLFTIDEIIHEIKTFNDEKGRIQKNDIENATKEFEKIVNQIKEKLDKEKNITTIQEYSHLFRKQLTSKLTDDFVRSIVFEKNEKVNEDELRMDSTHRVLCSILSKNIFKGATRNSSIALYELKGEIIIKSLFNLYVDKEINKDYLLLPPDYRPKETDTTEQKVRCVMDYIAGMMDTYAISEFERLTGISYDSMDVTKIPNVLKTYDRRNVISRAPIELK